MLWFRGRKRPSAGAVAELPHFEGDFEALESKHTKIRVQSLPGFAACVSVLARTDAPPDITYGLLTHQDNHKFFRAIKRVGERKIRRDNGVEQEVDVEHFSGWRFLFWSGEFSTKLRVVQNKHRRDVTFRLLSSDVMKDFRGAWTVKPYTQRAMDAFHEAEAHGPAAFFQNFTDSFKPTTQRSLLGLEQHIEPKHVPRALHGLIKKVAAAQVKMLMEDMDAEVERVKAGKATLPEFNKYAERGASLI